MGAGAAALGRAALAAALVLLYYGFSIGITFYNKWLVKVRGGGGGRGAVAAAAAVTAAVGPAELPVPAARHPAPPPAHLRALGAGPSPGALPLRAAAGDTLLGRLPPPGGPRRYGRAGRGAPGGVRGRPGCFGGRGFGRPPLSGGRREAVGSSSRRSAGALLLAAGAFPLRRFRRRFSLRPAAFVLTKKASQNAGGPLGTYFS